MWLTLGVLLLILVVGGVAELLVERASERYLDDHRADLRPGLWGWLSVVLALPIALFLLLVSFVMTEKAWSHGNPAQLAITVAIAFALVALALYFLWASYVTAFHRLRWDRETISRRTLLGRQSYPLALVKRVRGDRYFYTVDFRNGARWYLAPLRGINRLHAILAAAAVRLRRLR
jgi:hypothetical protein